MDTQTKETRVTALSAGDLEDFLLLLPRVFSDYRSPRRGPFRWAFVFGNTKDNEDSSLLRAIELASAGDIQSLGISEGELGHGYEGYDHSVERLRLLGWKDEWGIPIVKFDVGGRVNTRSEAIKFVDHLHEHANDGGPSDSCVIAPPFHILRGLMTMVSVMEHHPVRVALRVYAVPGVPLPWNERAAHSQGTLIDTRTALLGEELQRLEKYRGEEFGSMLTPGEVIKYLNWRDTAY